MSRPKGFLKILYCIIGIFLLIYSGYLVYILVMHIWHQEEKTTDRNINQEIYYKLAKGNFVDINKVNRQYEFHNVDLKYNVDKINLCVSCHGDVPHTKKKEIRSYLNMHSYFMGCEVCHIRKDKVTEALTFKWYNKIDGILYEKIDIGNYLGDTQYKLNIYKGSDPLYGDKELKDFIVKFKENEINMQPSAKSAAVKAIHKIMDNVSNSVKCVECHTKKQEEAYLDLKKIGYSDIRINQILGNEVVGLVERYNKFYFPDFLKPQENK